MTVLLDIDGVLIGWDGKPEEKSSGFSDWARPEPPEPFFNFISAEQLAFIAEKLGEHVQWHTTWIQSALKADHMTDIFTEMTGFGPWPIAVQEYMDGPGPFGPRFAIEPRNGAVSKSLIPEELHSVLQSAGWWKLNAVAALLAEGKLSERVVWVDDENNFNRWHIQHVLEFFGAKERFLVVSPDPVWSRAEILKAEAFLNGS